MPRQRRQESSTLVYHWITRGIHKKNLFHGPRDYFCYLQLLEEYKKLFDILIFHYCLMSNHSHLILSAKNPAALSCFSHYIQRRYAYYYKARHNWEGQVFRRPFKSFPIENDRYLLECGRYVERNPVKAGLVAKAEDYHYSSFAFYAFSKGDPIVDASPAYLGLSESEKMRNLIYSNYVDVNREHEQSIGGQIVKLNASLFDQLGRGPELAIRT